MSTSDPEETQKFCGSPRLTSGTVPYTVKCVTTLARATYVLKQNRTRRRYLGKTAKAMISSWQRSKLPAISSSERMAMNQVLRL